MKGYFVNIENNQNSKSLSINSGNVSGGTANAHSGGQTKTKVVPQKTSSIISRLDAIDNQYSYNASLTELFNRMDENRIT